MSVTFSIRLRPEEKARLVEAAGRAGSTTARFAYEAVMAAVERRRITVHQRDRDHLARQLAHIHAGIIKLVTALEAQSLDAPQGGPASFGDSDQTLTQLDAAELRHEIHALVSAVLAVGRDPTLPGESV